MKKFKATLVLCLVLTAIFIPAFGSNAATYSEDTGLGRYSYSFPSNHPSGINIDVSSDFSVSGQSMYINASIGNPYYGNPSCGVEITITWKNGTPSGYKSYYYNYSSMVANVYEVVPHTSSNPVVSIKFVANSYIGSSNTYTRNCTV